MVSERNKRNQPHPLVRGTQSGPRQRVITTPSPSSSSSSSSSDHSPQNLDLTTFYQAAWEVLYSLSPSKDDVAKRKRLISNFKRFTERFGELKGCIFEPYGSYASELYTIYGDVDLSVTPNDHQDILSSLKDCIKLSGTREFSSIKLLEDVRVPVLNFKYHDVPFDISVHTKSGKISALLFSRLKDMDIPFREVVLLVKGWATCNEMHGAYYGGFSSYALYAMVIFHFQTTTPPILPPLNELYTIDVMLKLKGADESWKDDFAINFARFKESRGLKEKNEWDIYEVFYDFIKKFKDISRKAKRSYMSVKRGQWVTKREWVAATPELLKQPLWIEEPFGERENIARSIRDVERISSAFKDTETAIRIGNKDDILQQLAPKDLLKVIEGTNWDAIPMRCTVEVGPKAIASRDRISLVSSAAFIRQSSAKILIPAKTKGIDANVMSSSSSHGDVLGLRSYASDDDGDKVQNSSIPSSAGSRPTHLDDAIEKSSSSSPGDVLGLACYASDEDEYNDASKSKQSVRDTDAGKHELPIKGGLNTKDSLSDEKNDNKMRSSSKDYNKEVETGMDKEHMKADENSKIQDEKHIKREKKDDQNGSIEKPQDSEKRDRRSHAEEDDRKQERKDEKKHKMRCSPSPGWQKRDRSPSPGRHRSSNEKLKERDSEKRVNKNEIKDDKKERDRDRTFHAKEDDQKREGNYENKHKRHCSLSPGKHRSSKVNSSFSCAHGSSDSSSRKVHPKRRDRSLSPVRSGRQVSRSEHGKHYQHRPSNYSSLERTRERTRSRSRT